MARQYEPTNLKAFTASLNIFDKKVKSQIAAILKETAKGCYEEIVATSPHLTGSYIASHRIGVNGIDGSDTVYPKKNPQPEGVVKQVALQQLGKLDGLKHTDIVYITNSVGFSNPNHYSWAANIEYTGWKGRGPYLVFEKALQFTLNRIPQYVNHIKEKISDPYIV